MQRYIKYMPLQDIPSATRNAKDHDLASIRRSIETFGCVVAGEIDERTGRLVAGHGRKEVLMAMCAEGVTPPEGVQLAEDGTWLAALVRGWRSRSDADAEAYMIAHNRTNERGGWDQDVLIKSLADIQQADSSLLAATGYSSDELADLEEALAVDAHVAVGVHDDGGEVDDNTATGPSPEEFQEFDDDIATDYQCPRCGYEWSGKPR
ncbi:hypothetical protein GBF35_25860 [Nonomuraea phyllanthi]|uniref:hypothetical protein n=1 Tax=Nonomuraea phyllanthi TaxID=2219224 RepID=UPI0012931FD4|nr:hypothetical protein [Nonomuraea phyllanthi]QFY09622.1 hypothetical protein GBF35_25860 [Nonomuraea phyllanthi]